MIQFGNIEIQNGINNKERDKYNEHGSYEIMTRISYGILNAYTTETGKENTKGSKQSLSSLVLELLVKR